MRALALVFLVASLAACVLGGPGDSASMRQPQRPRWMSRVAYAVGMCETQLDPRHSSPGYVSAWGFARSVWEWFRHPDGRGDPDQHTYPAAPAGRPTPASLWQQYRVTLRKVRHFHGWSGWGCWDGGGYRVWLGRA
jgi:hypothetical protein